MMGLALLMSAGAARAADFPLAGTWTLTAADRITPAGVREHDYGRRAQGPADRRRGGPLQSADLQERADRFRLGRQKRGAPEEYQDAALGSSTHYGTIALDAAAHRLLFKIEGASFKNWEGTTQRRSYDLKGDVLSYRVPTAPDGNTPISEWRRER
ncbi:lipocalin-like domain-containing protein [Caulobacter segnis]